MGQLDASIVTLALPRLGQELHAGVGAVEWVALSYLLVLVATVATVGRIADAVGRKLLYVYGFGVFTAGSVLCGLAPTLVLLIAARVLQAVGAAMLQANSVALITEAIPPRLLGRGIGVQGTAQAFGLALGPAVGGALLALGGWRLIFLVNVPAGAIGLMLGWFLLPRSRSVRALGRTDRLGAILLALAAAGPLLYLSLAGRAGYASPLLLVTLVAGAVAAIEFVRRRRRAAEPLIEIALFRRRALSMGLSTGLVSYLVLFGTLFVVAYYLSSKGTSAAMLGLRLAVLPVAIGIAAPIAGRFLNRLGGRPLTAGGLLMTAAGLLEACARQGTGSLLIGLALAGLGLGAFTPANNAMIMSASPRGHAGVVSGILNMTRGLGTAVGVALASATYIGASGATRPSASSAAADSGLTTTLAVLGSISLVVAVVLLLQPEGTRTAQRGSASRDRWPARPPSQPGEPAPTREGTRALRRRAPAPERRHGRRGTDRSATSIPVNARAGMLLADEWQRSSIFSFAVSALAGVRAAAARPRSDTGDLFVGLYFASLSLLFWTRALAIRRVAAIRPPVSSRIAALALGVSIGAALVVLDVAAAGLL